MAKEKVRIGGISQNIYITDRRENPRVPTPQKVQLKYTELTDIQLPNGFVQELVEKDYPINSESVSSYLESSDYRNDPASAIANAPKRVNLGDITEAQRFISENPVQATTEYSAILRKVADYFDKQKATPTTPQKTAVENEQQSEAK